MRYLGPRSPRTLAYGVSSVAGNVLAVCSCTVLPLFSGIYRAGAGLGPACTFLYAGPAINVLAIVLTFQVLGPELGSARLLGAVGFSVVIGLAMALTFRREERERSAASAAAPVAIPMTGLEAPRPVWQTALLFVSMVGILIVANGSEASTEGVSGWLAANKWTLTAAFAGLFVLLLRVLIRLAWWELAALVAVPVAIGVALPSEPVAVFAAGSFMLVVVTGRRASLADGGGEAGLWFKQTWDLAKTMLPLLLLGVFAAGFALGRPGHEGIIPAEWIRAALGHEHLGSAFLAALAGALMYFATLTEIPIMQGLLESGMAKGPALSLLLAGPAVSLSSVLVIYTILGLRKTFAYLLFVVVFSALVGSAYGAWVG